MKNFKNKVLVFVMLYIFIMSFITISDVNASRYTKTSDNLNLTNSADSNAISGSANEQEIEKLAGKDISDMNFRNLDALNIKIDKIWELIRWVIGFLSVFGIISSFFILSKSFLQLAFIPDHPIERRKCYIDIMTSGFCTIAFSGLSLIMTIFFKTFQTFLKNGVMISSNYRSAAGLFLVEYKYLITGACAVMSLTLIVLLIKDIVVLAGSGGNPHARTGAIKSIMFTLVGIVGSGAVGLIVYIFTGMLKI